MAIGMSVFIVSVNTAVAHNLHVGKRLMRPPIGKRARAGADEVAARGLEGDELLELFFYGGISQAVYAYPVEHYAYWQQRRQTLRLDWFEQALPTNQGCHL